LIAAIDKNGQELQAIYTEAESVEQGAGMCYEKRGREMFESARNFLKTNSV